MSAAAPRSRLTAGLAALIIAGASTCLLTACSSKGSGTTTAGAAGTAAAGPTSQAAASGSGSGSGATPSCTALTRDKVQPLLVKTITTSSAKTVPDQVSLNGTAEQCVFGTEDSSEAITVVLIGGADAGTAYLDAQQSLSKPVSVSGVGTKALRDAGDATSAITAEDNGLTCTADSDDPGQMPGLSPIYDAAGNTSDIGDKNYAVIAAALGTLCNVVFGSGNTTPDFSGLTSAGVTTPPDGGGLPTDLSLPTDGT
ncbi:MAG TPA: hypothetical protein VGX23_21485 [Actinocrinis sp.]|nr:hypothetical protein [Actinocrinis sp.]